RSLFTGWLSPVTHFPRSRSRVSSSHPARGKLQYDADFTPRIIFVFLFLTPQFSFTVRQLCHLIWPLARSNCSLPYSSVPILDCGGGLAHQRIGTIMTSLRSRL